jgi:riboflavin synthase alpha subunit
VNVEYDIIAKYIENLLSGNGKTSERGLTREYLAEIGWE